MNEALGAHALTSCRSGQPSTLECVLVVADDGVRKGIVVSRRSRVEITGFGGTKNWLEMITRSPLPLTQSGDNARIHCVAAESG